MCCDPEPGWSSSSDNAWLLCAPSGILDQGWTVVSFINGDNEGPMRGKKGAVITWGQEKSCGLGKRVG